VILDFFLQIFRERASFRDPPLALKNFFCFVVVEILNLKDSMLLMQNTILIYFLCKRDTAGDVLSLYFNKLDIFCKKFKEVGSQFQYLPVTFLAFKIFG
jgi:hypothetical protein